MRSVHSLHRPQFFKEVTLSVMPGSILEQCAEQAMLIRVENDLDKVLFNFNGVDIKVTEDSSVISVVSQYFEGINNED